MMRIFVKSVLTVNSNYIPSEEDCHYILQVLRMRPGEEMDIVDAGGSVYHARLKSADRRSCILNTYAKQEESHEPQTHITLYQSVSKGERMDLTIQKAVELGVSKIVPVISERCVVKLDGKQGKSDRWQKIALEAARQSGRDIVPVVTEPEEFSVVVRNPGETLRIIPWEEAEGLTLKGVVGGRRSSNIGIFIGPEGGYSAAEIDIARSCDITPVTLGPRILRTETAGPAVLAMIMYEMEL
ncbi:16S rRNA (uracil1498-N3)-methyltransferase [Ruminococcaceae bacterium YRB3002]|nr:16S rRNA (uracil1498-N3)-methyltransferase [Ruminococcaceae bacterium YRB3002]